MTHGRLAFVSLVVLTSHGAGSTLLLLDEGRALNICTFVDGKFQLFITWMRPRLLES